MKVMDKIEHLNLRLKQIGYEPEYGSLAFNDLTKSLKNNESVLYLLEGSIKNSLGFLIATDLRIFYIGVNKHKSPIIAHIKYEDITSVENTNESIIPTSEIMINGKDDQHIKIMGCEEEAAEKFVKLVKYFTEKNNS